MARHAAPALAFQPGDERGGGLYRNGRAAHDLRGLPGGAAEGLPLNQSGITLCAPSPGMLASSHAKPRRLPLWRPEDDSTRFRPDRRDDRLGAPGQIRAPPQFAGATAI